MSLLKDSRSDVGIKAGLYELSLMSLENETTQIKCKGLCVNIILDGKYILQYFSRFFQQVEKTHESKVSFLRK